jgi:hypothetical protein
MQILNATIQHIDGMDDSQLADVRYFQLNGAASEILGRQPYHTREKINLFDPSGFRAAVLLTNLVLFDRRTWAVPPVRRPVRLLHRAYENIISKGDAL